MGEEKSLRSIVENKSAEQTEKDESNKVEQRKTPQPKKNSNSTIIVILIILVFMVVLFLGISSAYHNTTEYSNKLRTFGISEVDSSPLERMARNEPISDQTTISAAGEDTQSQAPECNWSYYSKVDEMTDKTCYWAICCATNSVDFDFPYEGGSTMSLQFIKSPRYGKNAGLKISKGQFDCGYEGCTIRVRVDGGKVKSFSCSQAANGNLNSIVIDSYPKFISMIRKAKTIKIEAPFFNSGTQVFTFNVSGLEWNH